MFNFGKKNWLVFLLATLVLTACHPEATPPVLDARDRNASPDKLEYTEQKPLGITDEGCIPPGETFAFPINPQDGLVPIPDMLPQAPWKIVQTPFFDENDSLSARDVLASRIYNGQREIWLRNAQNITIYYPDTENWKNVPPVIGDSQVIVNELFITHDNAVFGIPSWQDNQKTTQFLLSKYNEATERFEYAPGTQAIQIPTSRLGPFPYIALLDATKEIFWVLVTDDGIYSYNPNTQVSQKHLSLPDVGEYTMYDATFSPDENIYYYVGSPGGVLTHGNTKLYRFEISTGELTATLIRLSPSEASSSIFSDHSGRVWFGALGWMEADGTWYQMVRSPIFITNFLWTNMEYRWKSPEILLESSDNRLWFRSEYNGLVWLDPGEEKWCWFTTYGASNIVEDQEQNLWVILGGELYQYPLN